MPFPPLRLAVLAMATALSAACSDPEMGNFPKAGQAPEPAWEWTPGPGDSYVYYAPSEPAHGKLVRCWRRGGSYDCINVQQIPYDAGMAFSAFRFNRGALPKSDKEGGYLRDTGYFCNVYADRQLLVTETVVLPNGVGGMHSTIINGLTSTPQWQAPGAIDLLSASSRPPEMPYFPCPALAQRIVRIGLGELARPELRYEDIMR